MHVTFLISWNIGALCDHTVRYKKEVDTNVRSCRAQEWCPIQRQEASQHHHTGRYSAGCISQIKGQSSDPESVIIVTSMFSHCSHIQGQSSQSIQGQSSQSHPVSQSHPASVVTVNPGSVISHIQGQSSQSIQGQPSQSHPGSVITVTSRVSCQLHPESVVTVTPRVSHQSHPGSVITVTPRVSRHSHTQGQSSQSHPRSVLGWRAENCWVLLATAFTESVWYQNNSLLRFPCKQKARSTSNRSTSNQVSMHAPIEGKRDIKKSSCSQTTFQMWQKESYSNRARLYAETQVRAHVHLSTPVFVHWPQVPVSTCWRQAGRPQLGGKVKRANNAQQASASSEDVLLQHLSLHPLHNQQNRLVYWLVYPTVYWWVYWAVYHGVYWAVYWEVYWAVYHGVYWAVYWEVYWAVY